jgi:acetylglutamate kinase
MAMLLRVPMLQAAAHTAEQQVSSLEAALQKGSQVTVSMTEKVAQALSAANSQVESLKVG